MKVPLLDLKAQYAPLRDEVRQAVGAVMDAQYFILGPEVAALEEEVAAYVGTPHAIGCASGTDALLLSLMALGVGSGDEVITTPFTFFATAGSISRCGATPVFVDIEEDTFNIDPAAVASAITDKTKAIMPVQLFGQSADMDAIQAVAGDIPVVEDAAQALSAEYKGKKVGSVGTLGCFSFFPSKNLGGFGDGGMITTDDEALATKLRSLRVHGAEERYFHRTVGFNSRLDALQATVLRVKLPHLDAWSDARAANAARYEALLDGAAVVTPVAKDCARHVYNQYTIRAQDRDGLLAHLKEQEIGCGVYYPLCLHRQDCFAHLGGKAGDMPVAEKASREVLSIPVYPELTEEMVEFVAATIRDFAG